MSITRDEIERRSTGWGFGRLTYSQSTLHPSGYRPDCSGYISMCWGTAKSGPGAWGGYSTVTLVSEGIMREIPWDDLRPGDAIGHCGPGTAGPAGHIMLWLDGGKRPGQTAHIRDFGSTPGPKDRRVTIPSNYRAYRYISVTDGVREGEPMGDFAITPQPPYDAGSRTVGVEVADIWGLIYHGRTPWDAAAYNSGGESGVWLVNKLNAILNGIHAARAEAKAASAADELRDNASLAALKAMQDNGGPDIAPAVEAIRAVHEEARIRFAELEAAVNALVSENTELRAALARAAQAEADSFKEG